MGNLSKMLLGTTLLTACLVACQEKTQINLTQSGLNPANFEAEFNGKKTQLFTMTNANGMEVSITNFGGRVVSIMVPDKEGKLRDVVLGFDSITQYVDSINTPSDFGAAIGRYANRIDQGKIAINGDSIQLPKNNFGHCLHGGPQGWQYQVYEGAQLNDSTITMELLSADGDAGFPGNMAVMVSYVLTSDNALEISYEATTDKTTIINMTNHSYFNLNGDPSQPITDHILYLNADNFTPVDATYMTTGEISPVENTPMDFRKEHKIGTDINKFSDQQIKNGNGYDHNWVLNQAELGDTVLAARVYSPSSGILLEAYTNEPGIQFYSGNFLDGVKGKKGIAYNPHAGFCLETQHYPNSPNNPEWPSVYLEPGETYTSYCVYKFSIK